MTYDEIIQEAGKRVQKNVYYIKNDQRTDVDIDNIESVKISFNSPLIGTLMQGAELVLKEPINDGEIYIKIDAQFQSYSTSKTYGPYFLKQEPTYQADSKNYLHVLYDAIIKSMVQYEELQISYPCTLYNFFIGIINACGYTTNISSLPNGSIQIASDKYIGLNYTYRDVLEDIAIANGILLYADGNEIKIAQLSDNNPIIIDDDILKNQNIEFGQHFGPINTIVLSRAVSDNIMVDDAESVSENGVHEYKISDNQMLNDNDRGDYIDAILTQLDGLEYDIYDTELTGYGSINPLQRVQFETGDNTYYSYVFNNEIFIADGYKQTIYTELPEETNTDYTMTDKTDKRINQTTLIVDKQKGRIDALVESTQDLTNYINVLENDSELTLTNTMTSNGAINYIEITNFSELNKFPGLEYPNDYSYPGITTTYTLVFTDSNNNTKECYLTIGVSLTSTDKIIVKQDSIEVIRLNQTITLDRKNVMYTFDETTKISLKAESGVHIKCEYIVKNDFTTQFALQGELGASVIITDSEITSKVSKAEVISTINQSAEQVQINSNKISLEGKTIDLTSDNIVIESNNFNVNEEGILECNSAILNNATIINKNGDGNTPSIEIKSNESSSLQSETGITNGIIELHNYSESEQGASVEPQVRLFWHFLDEQTIIGAGGCYSPSFTPTSRAEKKKNFKLLKSGLDIIKNIDIYEYNLKSQNDNEKKYIGFVIGDDFNYSTKLTDVNEQGANIYSFVSVCCKAIQEQQQIIENLQKEMEEIRNGKN